MPIVSASSALLLLLVAILSVGPASSENGMLKVDPKIFGRMEDYYPSGGVFRAKQKAVSSYGLSVMPNVQTQVCLMSPKVCAPYPQCGAYITCTTGKVVVCQTCGAAKNKQGGPANVCDFRHGRCVPNVDTKAGIAGALCTPGKANRVCGKEHVCSQDIRAKSTYRCCRKACPPGAFGSPVFYYQNNCGQSIMCPNGYLPNGPTGPGP